MKKMALGFILALCLAPMLLFAWLGTYSRPMSDDYCHIDTASRLNLWEYLLYWRGYFNGSFSDYAVRSLLSPFGESVVQVFPSLLIFCLFACTTALLRKCLVWLGIASHRLIISASLGGLVVAAVASSVTTPASLYWYAASIRYSGAIVPLFLYLLLLLYVADRPMGKWTPWLSIVVGGALCFFTAGFVETFTMPMLLGLTLLIGVLLAARGPGRRCLPALGAGWIATIASMMVMITAPGVTERAETITEHPVVASRSIQDILSLAGTAWLDHIADPAALASFIFMLAAGLLVALVAARPATTQASSLWRIPRNPWLFGIAVQLLLLPIIWSHHSDSPSILGRYSTGYFVVIACNAALITGMALLLWGRRRSDDMLARHFYTLPCALLAVILLLFALTQIRSIHWRANTYLWASIHSLLLVLAWQLASRLPPCLARRFAVGMGCLYITSWLGTAAVAIAVYAYSKEDILRTYTFLAHLVAWQGLAWGVALGWAMKTSPHTKRLLKTGALLVALWLGAAIVGNNLTLVPKFQQYAREFDARHAYILEHRQAGQRQFTFAPLSFDLPRYLSVAPLDTHHCPLHYYDIDAINLEAR